MKSPCVGASLLAKMSATIASKLAPTVWSRSSGLSGMKTLCLQLTPILLGSLFITGCKTLPVVPHAIGCDVSAELLSSKCATPKPITNDTTYATLVDTMQADRKALRECGVTADTLRDAIKRCGQATDEYNKKIDAINSTK